MAILRIRDEKGTPVDVVVLRGDKGNDGVSAEYAQNNLCNALKGRLTGKAITLSDAVPYPHEVKVTVNEPPTDVYQYGKNLFPSITETTKNGVTITKTEDGYVLNGTPSVPFSFTVGACVLPIGVYCISLGNPSTNGWVYIQATPSSGGGGLYVHTGDQNNSAVCNVTQNDYYEFTVGISDGYTYNNFVIKPQLEIGNKPTEYVPFVEPKKFPYDSNNPYEVKGIVCEDIGTTLLSIGSITVEYNRDINKAIEQLQALATGV